MDGEEKKPDESRDILRFINAEELFPPEALNQIEEGATTDYVIPFNWLGWIVI